MICSPVPGKSDRVQTEAGATHGMKTFKWNEITYFPVYTVCLICIVSFHTEVVHMQKCNGMSKAFFVGKSILFFFSVPYFLNCWLEEAKTLNLTKQMFSVKSFFLICHSSVSYNETFPVLSMYSIVITACVSPLSRVFKALMSFSEHNIVCICLFEEALVWYLKETLALKFSSLADECALSYFTLCTETDAEKKNEGTEV